MLAVGPPFYHFFAVCVSFQAVAHSRRLDYLSVDEQEIGASETLTTSSQKWHLIISAVLYLLGVAYHFYFLKLKEGMAGGGGGHDLKIQ